MVVGAGGRDVPRAKRGGHVVWKAGQGVIGKVRQERSRVAEWSAYFAALSIPVLIIAAVGHRSGLLAAIPTYGVIALGFTLAGLAVIAAVAAFAAIWRDGRKGSGAAVRGFVIGLLVLAMPAWGAWQVVNEPRLIDISTNPDDPPPLHAAASGRAADDLSIADPDPVDAALQREAYPDIVPRHYPVSTARVYQEARAIVDKRGWRVLASREPTDDDPSGSIEAVAVTLIFAFQQDVAIRIVPDGDGSRVDMRTAARNAAHDLGAGAARVRSFFAALDAALAGESSGDG